MTVDAPPSAPLTSGPVRVAKEAGRRLFRLAGSATARVRPLPDFLIIGTKRGGTTSLYYDILKLPQVISLFPSARYLPKANETKGVHFFDSNYSRGERWYRSFMPSTFARRTAERKVGKKVIVGEASPYYLFHPLAAERAAATVPGAKLIVLLRDPVMRTYSHWKERRRSDAEPLDFADALRAEPDRLLGEEQRLRNDPSYYSYAHEQQSYVAQSRYVHSLRRWADLFGMDRILVVASEEYYSAPAAALQKIADFLDIDSVPVVEAAHLNAARGDGIDAPTREYLADLFAGDNAQLEALIGRRLPWT
jgi:hypothetical protein